MPAGAATPPAPPWSLRRHEEERPRPGRRTPFEVDRDRIIHSATFRELQHKTQVQSVAKEDGTRTFRTRLNHVLEVAQIARGLAQELEVNEPLAEAIALVHDHGHTPFGHAGERALDDALKARGEEGFNANIHSLTVIDEVECAFPNFKGLNLTYATREGIARHSTPFDEPISFGEFAVLPNGGLECQIVDMADMLAYLSHDLDDAVRDGLIGLDLLAKRAPRLGDLMEIPNTVSVVWPPEALDELRRKRVVARLIGRLMADITQTSRESISTLGIASPEGVRERSERVVVQSPEYADLGQGLLALLKERYYRSDEVIESDDDAVNIVHRLFDAFLKGDLAIPARFSGRSRPLAASAYLASLNDVAARRLANQL